jgi:hypothetical protein
MKTEGERELWKEAFSFRPPKDLWMFWMFWMLDAEPVQWD